MQKNWLFLINPMKSIHYFFDLFRKIRLMMVNVWIWSITQLNEREKWVVWCLLSEFLLEHFKRNVHSLLMNKFLNLFHIRKVRDIYNMVCVDCDTLSDLFSFYSDTSCEYWEIDVFSNVFCLLGHMIRACWEREYFCWNYFGEWPKNLEQRNDKRRKGGKANRKNLFKLMRVWFY